MTRKNVKYFLILHPYAKFLKNRWWSIGRCSLKDNLFVNESSFLKLRRRSWKRQPKFLNEPENNRVGSSHFFRGDQKLPTYSISPFPSSLLNPIFQGFPAFRWSSSILDRLLPLRGSFSTATTWKGAWRNTFFASDCMCRGKVRKETNTKLESTLLLRIFD